jgi:hypothetical protein
MPWKPQILQWSFYCYKERNEDADVIVISVIIL